MRVQIGDFHVLDGLIGQQLDTLEARRFGRWVTRTDAKFTYTFDHFFHPYVGDLVRRMNEARLAGLFDVEFQAGLVQEFFEATYQPVTGDETVEVKHSPKRIDLSETGPYAVYNWELLFHVPFTIAVHLSKNQRFEEAQRWFHFIFDPTSQDQGVPAPQRFWKFLRFREESGTMQLQELLRLLSEADSDLDEAERAAKDLVVDAYDAIRKHPFQPHVVARTRHLAYKYAVVMKYLDNLIAWGDSLFRQDTLESLTEATQVYVLAANMLGPRPQRIPDRRNPKPKTFAQLRAQGLDELGNALVELESRLPLSPYLPETDGVDTAQSAPLWGLGRTLYFCIPHNDKLLGYWDTVADRLFKIRNCMNIAGVVRQLPLFEPPLDPGMLVKAAAGGIDTAGLVSGLYQPVGPVRALLLIQKAQEMAGEVRSLGASLLAVLEKKDAEALARLRQQHEVVIRRLALDVRYLQWKEAEESTEALLKSRETALERYKHFTRLLGGDDQRITDLSGLTADRRPLTAESFDELYRELVQEYEVDLDIAPYPAFEPGGDGVLHLNRQEDRELNELLPSARARHMEAHSIDLITSALYYIPNFSVKMAYWGIGGDSEISGGEFLGNAGRAAASAARALAVSAEYKATSAGKTAGYERRTEGWILEHNLAQRELAHLGRLILASLIREQITRHDYEIQQKQTEQAEEIDSLLREKYTSEALYGWMQGELSKLYYEYYKLAYDTARRAEQTMKHELLRPEIDDTELVKFNYWDAGRKGLLAGEALSLDVRRMEMTYHEQNKREYELVRHISLRQLDPQALLALQATGSCEVHVPEWLFDLDCPGHYMRRIRSVSVSIPAVTGPYASVNCTLSLLRSSIRRSPALTGGEYARQGSEDGRFQDYYGTVESVVTSHAQDDAGLFETHPHDLRYLPFEGSGACSSWRLELPATFRQFDYDTISDVVLHMRYTARDGGAPLRAAAEASLGALLHEASESGLARLFSLQSEFATEWHRFVSGEDDLTLTLKLDHFPYLVQSKGVVIERIELWAVGDGETSKTVPQGIDPATLTKALRDDGMALLRLPPDGEVLVREKHARVFLLCTYALA